MSPDDVYATLDLMFEQTRAHFGNAVKGTWFYQGDPCPGCGGKVDTPEYESSRALSLNAFIYRKRGILIGYFLCADCADRVFKAAQQKPGVQTPLHETIEKALADAFDRQQH